VSPAILEDLIQEIYLKFCENQCRLLREFKAQHPNAFLGFLKVVAANVVHDHYRAAHSKKRGSNDFVESLGDGDEPAGNRNSGNLTGVDRELLLLEINAALNRATQESEGRRNRLIFWLYYRQGFSAQAIASLPYIGLNTKGVESAILRLTRSVREELAVSNSEQQKTRHADRD
jgi:RNA polymerase sigma-70 factor (ECF subfamily)